MERALGRALQSEPGTGYQYSNVGYSLLAAIIELRSGLTYEAYLQQALFDPVGMRRTGYQLPQRNPLQR